MTDRDSLLQLLRGKFTNEIFEKIKKIIPSFKLVLFFSSTFTDTHAERNIIMEEILPQLQLKAKEFGISVIFVDMRFGVKDENTKDHMTWIACAEQIQYCYEESDGMFFMSLQGDKYGYMPIPKFIDRTIVDSRLEQADQTVEDLFKKWYLLDENNVPAQYSLKPLLDKDDNEFWSIALPALRKFLEGISYDQIHSSDIVVHRSVTEWEALYAMKLSPDRCFWFHRIFESGIDITYGENKKVYDYCDFLTNQLTREKFNNLLSVMSRTIRKTNIIELKGPKLKSYIEKDDSFTAYLNVFKTRMITTLVKELDDVISKALSWNKDGGGLGLSGNVINEMVHHCKILADKNKTFHGRDKLVQKSIEYIKGTNKNKTLLDISLCIVGISGSGKTALMSKLASSCHTIFSSIPIIVRYCGTSKSTVDGLDLITSICQQIQLIYGLEFKAISSIYTEAVTIFHELLLAYPVILFIDSLDQLSDLNLARSKLSFLVGVKCHRDTRIIVSTLPDDKDKTTNKWGKYVYLCDTRLAEFKTPRVVVEAFQMGSIELKMVMSGMISMCNRKLNDLQMQNILKSLSYEPTALYLNLAINVVRQWTTVDGQTSNITDKDLLELPLKSGLRGTVSSLINQIFDQLEKDYGERLTRYAVGFITFSKAGISDIMMQDLLSLRDDVLVEVFQYSKPAKYERLPFHVWLRLCFAMKGLIVLRSFNCWNWYHRQLSETIITRYSEAEINIIHKTIGCYMSNIVPQEITANRLITSQPLTFTNVSIWFDKSVINHQRFIEGYYHLIYGDLLLEAVQELTNFDVICGCILANQSSFLIKSIMLLLAKLKASNLNVNEYIKRVTHYYLWLYKDLTFIAKQPRQLITISATSEPITSVVRKDMTTFIKKSKQNINQVKSGLDKNEWYRGRIIGGFDSFSQLLATLEGHTEPIHSVCLSGDGNRVISGSSDNTIKVWDVISGTCINTLEGHSDCVYSVCMSSDGSRIVSGSGDKTVKVWDTITGTCIKTLEGHNDWAYTVCISKDGKRIISGSFDHSGKIWDAVTGKCVKTLEGHSAVIRSVCISNDGSRIISGSSDNTVKVWDALHGTCLKTLSGHDSGEVYSVCISIDGKRIIAADNCNLKIWDAERFTCLSVLKGESGILQSVCISANGEKIISALGDTIQIWDVVRGTCLITLEAAMYGVKSVCLSTDGSRIISTDGNFVKIWDALIISSVNFEGHNKYISSVCLSHDESRIVSGSWDKTMILWDADSGACINTLKGHTGYIHSICWSKNDKIIISGSEDQSLKVWDAVTCKCIKTLNGHSREVLSVCLSSDGSRIISGSYDKTVKVWDALSGSCVKTLQGHDFITSVCISSDGKRFIAGNYASTMIIWDAVSYTCLNTLKTGLSKPINSLCINNNGSKFVSALGHILKIWDAISGICLKTFEGHDYNVNSVCLTSDGSKIISGSDDNTIKVWDTLSGRCLNTLEGHRDRIKSVFINSDGSKIVSGSDNKILIIWDSIINNETLYFNELERGRSNFLRKPEDLKTQLQKPPVSKQQILNSQLQYNSLPKQAVSKTQKESSTCCLQ